MIRAIALLLLLWSTAAPALTVGSKRFAESHVLAEIAATNAKIDALGLVLDSDPRRVTKTGSAQSSDPATDPEPDPGQPDTAQQD